MSFGGAKLLVLVCDHMPIVSKGIIANWDRIADPFFETMHMSDDIVLCLSYFFFNWPKAKSILLPAITSHWAK